MGFMDLDEAQAYIQLFHPQVEAIGLLSVMCRFENNLIFLIVNFISLRLQHQICLILLEFILLKEYLKTNLCIC